MSLRHVFIGYEPREAEAFAVACQSIYVNSGSRIILRGLLIDDLVRRGLYRRPTRRHLGKLIDELSATDTYDGSMATEFAISRFFVPQLVHHGWALFADCDILARRDLNELFDYLDGRPDKALACVPHDHVPTEATKMDGQRQTSYFRKNWSSVMAFNCEHPAHDRLTLDMLNTLPGRDLHRFCWLKDDEIMSLPVQWNWLCRVDEPIADPAIVHYTLGGPWLSAFHDDPYADEWRMHRNAWARRGPAISHAPIVAATDPNMLRGTLPADDDPALLRPTPIPNWLGAAK